MSYTDSSQKTINLGKLTPVSIREIWKHEQYDFSAWLSQPENLSMLSEVIGVSIVDPKTEADVGEYRCDILATDEMTGALVIIENQLEPSNHDHLGKLITYASGHQAQVVVWIVSKACPEHRSAIQWLNEKMEDSITFFLLEIHAFSIGESLPAAKFELIEGPNEFNKDLLCQKSKAALDEAGQQRKVFWSQCEKLLHKAKITRFNFHPDFRRIYIGMGSSVAKILGQIYSKPEEYVELSIFIREEKALYDALFAQKEAIEKELGYPLQWHRQDDKTSSRIFVDLGPIDLEADEQPTALIQRFVDTVKAFTKVFQGRVKGWR